MSRRSLGFATDLAVLARQGAIVEERVGSTVVRMPGNPGFRSDRLPEGRAEARIRPLVSDDDWAAAVAMTAEDAEDDERCWSSASAPRRATGSAPGGW